MSGPKRTIVDRARRQKFTLEIIATFQRAAALWDAAHDDDEGPAHAEWRKLSKRLNWTLLGLPPHCCQIEDPALDGPPYLPSEYAQSRDWLRCQRIRRALMEATVNRLDDGAGQRNH
jgi:hypothetical protein